MPADDARESLWVHATAVAIGSRALLITGRSGTGKSRLAAALLAASRSRRPIALVGDDRVLLTRTTDGLRVRPHPRIAGFIERRGFGFVAVPWRECAFVAGWTMLDNEGTAEPGWLENLPIFRSVDTDEASLTEAVLAWWPTATAKRHRERMPRSQRDIDPED